MEVKRKIEYVWCKKGRGNSYVVTAYDIGADGKIDRTKETEYKIDETLLSLIKAATMAGSNYKMGFVSPEATEDGPVDANEGAPTAAVEEEEEEEEEKEEEEEEEEEYHSERDDHYFDEDGNSYVEEGAVE